MNNYLSEIDRILHSSDKVFDSMTIVNSDGIIEYVKRYTSPHDIDLIPFHKNVIGKHLLDAYPDITEETSTVMETLRTGKITRVEKQTLTAGEIAVTISAITYPILGEEGCVQGAIDAVKVLNYEDHSTADSDQCPSALSSVITKNAQMVKLKNFVAEDRKSVV